MSELQVGQIYEETDPRAVGRRFRILQIDGQFVQVVNVPHGLRRTRIRKDRLRPTLGKRGYRLVEGDSDD